MKILAAWVVSIGLCAAAGAQQPISHRSGETLTRVLGSSAFTHDPLSIEIESSWVGLGNPTRGRVFITGKDGKYRIGGHKVSAAAVAALLVALDAPIEEQPSLAACGIDDQWLADNYKVALKTITHRNLNELSTKQVELFRSHFTNRSEAQAAFVELFKVWHTDDDPDLSVIVRKGDGEYGVRSDSQYPFLLPWSGTDRARGGYNCKIGQAVFALVGKDFPNRDRLAPGEEFRWRFANQVMNSIRNDWNRLDTEYKIGPALAPVFARFSVMKTAISNTLSIDLDGDQSWNAELQSPDLPANFIFGVSLRYHNRALGGVDELLERTPKYATLVLSVPWLANYIENHPKSKLELRYVNGQSLSPLALQSLTRDLQEHGKSEVAKMVQTQASDSAFVEVNSGRGCWSRAVVLPTRDVLLWHFKCDAVLGLSAREFDTWDYFGWRSTGTIIGIDGTVKHIE